LTPDSYLANGVDVTYTWLFTPSNDLEEDSYILLTYPENDYVLITTPQIECDVSGGLRPKENESIVCEVDSNTVKISNFQAFAAG